MVDLSKFEENIEIAFNDKELLRQAFTHRSFINEHRYSDIEHNERLEFLGDAVLELVVTEFLFTAYPNRAEGELTSYRSALVNTNSLSAIAQKLGINEFLLLSKGEARDTGRARQYILANTFEAVVGAIYLDRGYDASKEFIGKNMFHLVKDIVEKNLWQDPKSRFQEKAQEVVSITPTYKTIKEEGPDHDKHFTVGVFLEEDLVVTGEGKSKQEAEQAAAEAGLKKKGWV